MDVLPADRFDCPPGTGNQYVEHLRVDALSAGTYSIRAGGIDDQQPHTEDEVYAVLRGRGEFPGADPTVPVTAGTRPFPPARAPPPLPPVARGPRRPGVFPPPPRPAPAPTAWPRAG